MHIELGAHVRTSDGHRLGEIKRVVWDPATNEVRDFVVSTGGLIGHDVLISREVIEPAADKGELTVALTKDELNGLEHYNDSNFAPPPYGWMAPATYTYPIASYLFPTDPAAVPLAAPSEDAVRPRRPVIKKGMKVRDVDGGVIGEVSEVRIDDMTGELRSILIDDRDSAGLANANALEIPADHIDVGDGDIHVIGDVHGTHVTKREGI